MGPLGGTSPWDPSCDRRRPRIRDAPASATLPLVAHPRRCSPLPLPSSPSLCTRSRLGTSLSASGVATSGNERRSERRIQPRRCVHPVEPRGTPPHPTGCGSARVGLRAHCSRAANNPAKGDHRGPPLHGTTPWDPSAGPLHGTPSVGRPQWDPSVGPLSGTPQWDPCMGALSSLPAPPPRRGSRCCPRLFSTLPARPAMATSAPSPQRRRLIRPRPP